MLDLEKLAQSALNQKPDHLWNIAPRSPHPYYWYFMWLVGKEMNAKLAVELGTDAGSGTRHLADACKMVHTYDVNLGCKDALKNVPVYKNIRFHNCDSRYPWCDKWWPKQCLENPKVARVPDNIDILFIDADHSASQTEHNMRVWLPRVRDGGIIFYDDITLNDEMKAVWEKVPMPKFAFNRLHHTGFGVQICVKPTTNK